MEKSRFTEILSIIESLYPNEKPIPLHAPRFLGNEKEYLAECIDSTFVSYVGRFVSDFEEQIKSLTGARNAIAIVNGTAALHMALLSVGVNPGDEVITQALTFAATAAAIRHVGSEPVFVDVDRDSMGMSPESLRDFFKTCSVIRSGQVINKRTGRRIAAVVPMHTFGHPVRIQDISDICATYGVTLVEDAAESIGSTVDGKSTGMFGTAAVLSFNGNKPITTGGGGMIISNDDSVAERARYLSTTAKRKHRWEFFHDDVGYNLRLPNVNAAIGCAQMEYFSRIIDNKRETAELYRTKFSAVGIPFVTERKGTRANYWLNAIILSDRAEREAFLAYSNDNGIQTRPIWTLMIRLPPYEKCFRMPLPESEWLEDRIVNIPSSVR